MPSPITRDELLSQINAILSNATVRELEIVLDLIQSVGQ